ncbi:MAG: hypothetical protein ACJZ59_07815 [Candidatus Thalassarchaeaceae archaeon]
MTNYENIQSSDLYPTTGDFCDWHYGVLQFVLLHHGDWWQR